MNKLLLLSFLCLNVVCRAQTTVRICPHFNGQEDNLTMIDSTCAPGDYHIDSADATNPIITYMSWTSSGCGLFTRQLIRFADLTNPAIIPAGSTILSAKLYLYGVPSTPTGDYGNSTYPGSPYNGTNKGWIYELASPYTPSTTSWRTQPDVLHTDSVAIPASTLHWGTTDSLDVTSMVSHLYTSGNKGFLFKMDSEVIYREHIYASSRYSDSTLHPALKVTADTFFSIACYRIGLGKYL